MKQGLSHLREQLPFSSLWQGQQTVQLQRKHHRQYLLQIWDQQFSGVQSLERYIPVSSIRFKLACVNSEDSNHSAHPQSYQSLSFLSNIEHPSKTQIRLHWYAVWSESSMDAQANLYNLQRPRSIIASTSDGDTWWMKSQTSMCIHKSSQSLHCSTIHRNTDKGSHKIQA